MLDSMPQARSLRQLMADTPSPRNRKPIAVRDQTVNSGCRFAPALSSPIRSLLGCQEDRHTVLDEEPIARGHIWTALLMAPEYLHQHTCTSEHVFEGSARRCASRKL